MPIVLNRRVVAASTVGNILEWYDFAVFGFFAAAIGNQFFPSDDHLASLINTFGVFAAGYLMRPLGGVIFGHIGDRVGRRRALQISVMAMAIPTTLIAVLPTHADIGVWAAVLLVILRLAQGGSVGGEFMGSISYLVEISPEGRRGFYGSWTTFSVVGGILLGSAVATLLTNILSADQIADWGWRLPFAGGIFLGGFGLWIRLRLQETPEFVALQQQGLIEANPNLQALREMPAQIVHLGAVVIVLGVSIYTLFIWMPTYLTEILSPPIPGTLLINTLAMVLLGLLIPFYGRLVDVIGFKAVLAGGSIALAIIVYPLFLWIDTRTVIAVIVAMAAFAIVHAAVQAASPLTIASMVPTRIRYSAMALGYNVTLAVFGGTAPLVATWLIKKTGDLAAPAWYLVACGIIGAMTTVIVKPADR